MSYEHPHAIRQHRNHRWIVWLILAVSFVILLGVNLYIASISQGTTGARASLIAGAVLVCGLAALFGLMQGHWRHL